MWSPDGTQIAWVSEDASGSGQIVVATLSGRGAHPVSPRQPFPHAIAWAPDASALAYVSDRHVWRLDLATGAATQLTDAQFEDVSAPSWSPDGRTIAYASFEGCFRCTGIHLVSATGGHDRVLVAGPRRPLWNRDGTQILTSMPVELVDIATGAEHKLFAGGVSASWSVDHSAIVFIASGVELTAPDRVVPPRVVWHGGSFALPALNLSATRLAVVRGRAVWERLLPNRQTVRLPRSDSRNDAPAWSFRGALAYVGDGRCGDRTEIDVARPDGTHPHAIARSC